MCFCKICIVWTAYMCVCVCVCMYVCTHIYNGERRYIIYNVNVYICRGNEYVWTYIHICMCVCMCVCACVCVCVCVCVCIWISRHLWPWLSFITMTKQRAPAEGGEVITMGASRRGKHATGYALPERGDSSTANQTVRSQTEGRSGPRGLLCVGGSKLFTRPSTEGAFGSS